MATFTTRLALRKPDGTPVTGDLVNVVTDINQSMDKIDAALGAVPCTSGAHPGSPYDGQFARETDTGNLILWNGAAWKRVFMETDANFPDGLRMVLATTGTVALSSIIGADTQDTFKIFGSGELQWGAGGASATDVVLKRHAANVLRLNDSFIIDNDLTVSGLQTIAGSLTVTGLVVPGQGFFFKERVLYTSSGSFTKASYTGIRGVICKVWGAGGGSGGRAATSASQVTSAGGGGGGGYAEKWIPVASLASSETVTVGAGGTAGASGGGNGGAGGTSSFGAHASATGGAGAGGSAAVSNTAYTVPGTPGAGGAGTASGGFTAMGGDGGYGTAINGIHIPGHGGDAAMGAGCRVGAGANGAGGSGNAGMYPGGGAAGANSGPSNGAVAGAAGADGLIVVDVYV